jgi:hypothetical protein
MPYVLVLFGTILFVAGIRNTQAQLWSLVVGDVSGQDSFLVWIAALAVVGGIGYIPKLKPLSIALMTLLLLVLIIKNNGVFAQLSSFVQNPGATASGSSPATTATPTVTPLQPIQPLG